MTTNRLALICAVAAMATMVFVSALAFGVPCPPNIDKWHVSSFATMPALSGTHCPSREIGYSCCVTEMAISLGRFSCSFEEGMMGNEDEFRRLGRTAGGSDIPTPRLPTDDEVRAALDELDTLIHGRLPDLLRVLHSKKIGAK